MLLLCMLLLPAQVAWAAPADEGYYIQDYHVEVVVNTDRSYEVTETIDVWFTEPSHGIYREIPTYSTVESYRIVDLRAVGDPFVTERTGKIRIGDADVEIKGQKTYTIKYTLAHYADAVPDADYFYMDIIGTNWDTVINEFSARITLPGSAIVEKYKLTGGPEGSTGGDHLADVSVEGNIILIEGRVPLEARNGITLNVRMPEGTFSDAVIWTPPLEIESLDIRVSIDRYGVVTVKEDYTAKVNKSMTFYRGLSGYDGARSTPSYKVTNKSVTNPYGWVYRDQSDVDLYRYIGQTVDFSINYTLVNRLRESRANTEFFLNFMNGYGEKRIDRMTVVIDAPFDITGFVYDGWSGEGILSGPEIDGTRLIAHNNEPFFNQGIDYIVEFEGSAFVRRLTVLDFALPIALGVGALCMLYFAFRYRREKMMVETVEFYPPEVMNPAEVGYIIDDHVSGRDVTSLVYFWASHGHLHIEMTGVNSFTLHRLAELDESHPGYERAMFEEMWALGTGGTVRDEDLKETFYSSVSKAGSGVRAQFTGVRALYEKGRMHTATRFGVMILLPVFIAMLILTDLYWSFVEDLAPMIGIVFVLCLLVLIFAASYRDDRYKSSKKGTPKLIACIAMSAIGIILFAGTVGDGTAMLTASAIISGAAIFIITYAAPFLMRRSDFGVAILGRCIGFRTFLTTAEKDRLEMLLEYNPNYYYDILPYAQVLKVTKIWQSKFDGMLTGPPSWCYGAGVDMSRAAFDIGSMSRIMDTMGSNMTSSPASSDSGGGGSFSSGGSSGGGSGGGGGGRW